MMESQSARTEDEKIRNNAAFFLRVTPAAVSLCCRFPCSVVTVALIARRRSQPTMKSNVLKKREKE